MIARLSTLLRATIHDSDAQVVPLDREIETLELYLDIMRHRFEDRLSVDVRIAPEVRKALVPHLLLQPLVENSIRHGSDPLSNAVTVTVTAERDGANTRVRIRDSGRGLFGWEDAARYGHLEYGRSPGATLRRRAFARIRELRRRRPGCYGGRSLPDMIRVLIADDEPPARRKVRRFLENDPEIGEIQEAGSGEQALAILRDFAPDLVFLDVQMPGMDGFMALDAAPKPRDFHVVFHELPAREHHALRQGLSKPRPWIIC